MINRVPGYWLDDRNIRQLYDKYANATMCNAETFMSNIYIVDEFVVTGGNHDGCVVECGTWRGGMIAGIAEVLGPQREYILCDSFQGLPPAQPIDGPAANKWQREDPDNCRATVDEVHESMDMSGVRSYRLVEGWFSETLPRLSVDIESIALLRLDADWYDSTRCCLVNLWNKVVDGGIIIIDDYYVWDGCSRAVHDFLAQVSAVERIRSHEDVAYIVKDK